jgi:hypothetical protein
VSVNGDRSSEIAGHDSGYGSESVYDWNISPGSLIVTSDLCSVTLTFDLCSVTLTCTAFHVTLIGIDDWMTVHLSDF